MIYLNLLIFIIILARLRYIFPAKITMRMIVASAIFNLTSSIFIASFLLKDFSIDYLLFWNFEINQNFILAIVSSILAGIITFFILYKMSKISYQNDNISFEKHGLKATILCIICFFIIFLGVITFNASGWIVSNFGGAGIQEIIYTVSQPLVGTDSTQVLSFLFGPLNTSILFSIITYYTFIYISLRIRMYREKKLKETEKKSFWSHRVILFFSSLAILVGGLGLGIGNFGYAEVKAYFFEKSTIFEDEYKSAEEVRVTFPEKKRNLIYIFVESLETSYFSKDLGGALDDNLLPSLSALSTETNAVNFSNTESLGGALPTPGTGFTVGGMVAETAGIPLNVVGGLNANDYGNTSEFLPGASTLGQLLEEQNYRQMLLLGSDATFGGRDKYFTQHGNYEIRDYYYAVDNNWIPKEYQVWWGYEDRKLFDFAEQSLTELAAGDQPFNFAMLTADTHFPDGYVTEDTEDLYDSQYKNVIHSTDQMLGAFVSWLQQQDFYENTTIIISGDHLTMDTGFSSTLPADYERNVFNLIINAPISSNNTKNRKYSTMDLFPTTLAALNVSIDGDRLGLGTNLYSDKDTLIEKLGYESVVSQLSQRSDYYEKEILQGTDLQIKIKNSSE